MTELIRDETATVEWDKVVAISRATPTLQVVGMPPFWRASPLHSAAFALLAALGHATFDSSRGSSDGVRKIGLVNRRDQPVRIRFESTPVV